MRRRLLSVTLLAAAVGLSLAAAPGEEPAVADPDFVRGVSLGLFATDPDWDYGSLVEEIAARGATDVLVVVNAYQSDRFASDIALRDGHSPHPEAVARTLRQIRGHGMRAAVMPVVRLERRGPREWRGTITPADGLDAWFDAYAAFVLPLADAAEREGAARFVVGSELSSLEAYETRWRGLVAEVRARFSGRLTYSANWDRLDAIPFWDALDEVGVTAYFPLARRANRPSADALARAWRGPRSELQALRERVGRPLVLTEVGYPSHPGAASRPWDETSDTEVDLALQRDLYGAFCAAFVDHPTVDGFYVWNWFGFGGPRDPSFTPRGKPAADVLSDCFSRPFRRPTSETHHHER